MSYRKAGNKEDNDTLIATITEHCALAVKLNSRPLADVAGALCHRLDDRRKTPWGSINRENGETHPFFLSARMDARFEDRKVGKTIRISWDCSYSLAAEFRIYQVDVKPDATEEQIRTGDNETWDRLATVPVGIADVAEDTQANIEAALHLALSIARLIAAQRGEL